MTDLEKLRAFANEVMDHAGLHRWMPLMCVANIALKHGLIVNTDESGDSYKKTPLLTGENAEPINVPPKAVLETPSPRANDLWTDAERESLKKAMQTLAGRMEVRTILEAAIAAQPKE